MFGLVRRLIERSHLSFSSHANKGKSLEDTYMKMIEQAPRATTGTTHAVQHAFPTLRSLMETYDELESADRQREEKHKKAPMMLAELVVSRP